MDRGLIREKPECSLAKRPVKCYAGSNLACPLLIGWPGPTPRVGAADGLDLLRAQERQRSPAGGSVRGGATRGLPEMAELGPPGV